MRAGLACSVIVLAMAAQPVLAQGKSKAPATPQSVAALEVCERFASGDVLAVEAAQQAGWDAYTQESESPYIRSFGGSVDLRGVGYADMFALIETYPTRTFGYCRIDVASPTGDGQVAIQAIQNLDRYEGEAQQVSEGSFASLSAVNDPDTLLLAHWTADAFVIQLTKIAPRNAAD